VVSAFLFYANQYTKPFNEVTSVMTQLQSAIAGAKRLMEVIEWTPEQADAPDATSPEHAKGEVQLNDVFFSYDPSRPLISNFTMEAKPGQRIALVGPTGCGKTTIINLLMRFYEIESGSITVDGQSIIDIKRNTLRSRYGMVLQETWLKKATVAENIAYGRPSAGRDEIISVAKAAYAHSFIMQMPNGYDTIIESGGGNLSAGQKQLLCIARIMLARPDMLILDEATSSIDTRTEILIQKALDRLMQGHTSFIVAHRLSTIQNADCILVMKNGRIIERGSHENLLAQGGFYAKLFKSQFQVE
ncbi:MAG: ABC transporter ATP-binding protein, partial [Sporomusa sp.]